MIGVPVCANDFNVRVILYYAQYHTHALMIIISDCSKETQVIAGNPEATLCVNNKITSVFRWHTEFQVTMPGASGHVTCDEQD